MHRYSLFGILGLLFLMPLTLSAATDDSAMMSSVLKIKTYQKNPIDGSYSPLHYGSAVLIDEKRLVTNAHVVLDSDGNKPTGYYEVCRTEQNKKVPTCFTTGKLLYFDKLIDLAVLEIATTPRNTKKLTLSEGKSLSIGTSIIVYGYPGIGGASITRTEGKIGGFEDENYKFDGTIDHGNSGGGAFSSDGKLIGIPYAIKSENGLIGYIIPTSVLTKFLTKKTDNLENFTEKQDTKFANYVKSIQAFYKTPNLIKSKYVEVKNAEKNGFLLKDVSQSPDGTIFTLKFFDKKNRVYFALGCSKDAQTTWKNSFEFGKDMYTLYSKNKDYPSTLSEVTDPSGQTYSITYTDKKETKGERGAAQQFFYKNAPTCTAVVISTDPQKKDKVSYDKAIALLKSVKFTNTPVFAEDFISPYFTLKNIPKNVVLSEAFPLLNGNELTPAFGVMFDKLNIYPSATIDLIRFETVGEYMEYASSYDDSYASTYTFDEFYNQYKSTGYSNISDTIITSKNGKKLIMTIADYSDTDTFPVKYEKYLTFFYPFKSTDGKYYATKIQFILRTSDESAIYTIRDTVEKMEFPGTSPFTK